MGGAREIKIHISTSPSCQRSIKLSNAAFQQRVAAVEGTVEILELSGFQVWFELQTVELQTVELQTVELQTVASAVVIDAYTYYLQNGFLGSKVRWSHTF